MKDKIYIEEICIGENCAGYCNLFDIESLYEEIIRDILTEEEEKAMWSKEDEEDFGEFSYSLKDYFPVTITYAEDFDSPLNEITIYYSEDYKKSILSFLEEIYQ